MKLNELVNSILFRVSGLATFRRANQEIDKTEDVSEQAARGLATMERRMERSERASRNLGRGLRRVATGPFRLFTGALKAIFSPIGLLAGAAGIGGLAVSALRLAGDVEETRDKMRFALGDIADETEEWVRRTARALGLNRNNVRQFVTDFSLQLQTATDRATATDLARELTERAFDVESFFNVPIEEVFTSFRSGLNGSSEPLEKFNVNIRESALQAFILENGLARSKREIDDNTRRLARLQIILRDTAVAQGNLNDTSQSFTNQTRRFRNEVQNLVADIGSRFLPTATRILQGINKSFAENQDEILAFFDRIAVRLEQFVANGGLQSIADGFETVARAALATAKAILAVVDALTFTQQEQDEIDIRTRAGRIRNARVREEAGIFNFFESNPSITDADRALARQQLIREGEINPALQRNGFSDLFANSSSLTVNQEITVDASNGDAATVERAVAAGANNGVRGFQRVTQASGVNY